ncbi:DNA polymerase III subunit gamma/tau [Polaromonas naphthalenivorans]|uniref:DNA polymerase III subunit gamma/tau n=1 Tax=Polaromonas naphthalenivorans (strain CJ2) TaxID=365044 RepID=A1VMV5_POLNA|nr:DNA polymerase III subunit gamma/tau [Polaromonas naphthalenivorans]ABM36983.1 DNA polymerase III, subunits gamma and tau [Polaromonas naphthalenivorans CJ2]
MSYLVLARKYRPKNFSEMVGQSHVVQALGNALGTGRLHHAYLFTGTRGVGKTTVSRILAKSLNCTGPDGQGGITATPCGVCDACRDIDSGRFVDYTELDAASNRGVDEIAQLLEQAVYKPVVGRFKVFMIDEVHMLTNTAFNAMLKTLEEPPEYLKFVLATTDPQKVPATVLSRCLQFNLRPMAPETVLEHLVQVLALENVPAEPQALRLLSRAARGSMRDALSLTDQAIAFGSGRLDEASVRVMLGSVDRSYVFRLLDALARGDGRTVVETSEVLRLNGLSAASTLEEMATILQRMAVLQAVPGMGAGDDDTDPEIAETARLAQAMPADETQLLYSLCLHGRGELGLAPDEYAALTMVLLRLLAFKPQASSVASPVAVKPAPGSAAEPAKKPLPEQAAAPAVHRIPATQSRPAVVPAVQAVPAPVSAPVYESNKPFAHAGQARAAINSVAPEKPPADQPVMPTASSPGTLLQDASLCDAWGQLVNQLVAAEAIAALTRELALQSELRSRSEGVWTLRVERESLSQPAAREKLQLALQAALVDPALQLAVEVGPVTDTPARRNGAALAERQRAAEALIQNDPFVQDMIRDWGARIVPGSIKSVSP